MALTPEVSEAAVGDKYRSHIYGEGEKNTKWRFGAPPNYDIANKLFEEGRTKEWPKGSVEEMVQHLVKTWEMEIFHKVKLEDYKTVNPQKYTLSLNGILEFPFFLVIKKQLSFLFLNHNHNAGGPARSLEELVKLGGYNVLLQTSLPQSLRGYDPAVETVESSHKAFTTTFPRGFALEIFQVYSGPPVITYKFRHWAFMEGPFKGHAPTGEMVQFFGVGIFQVDQDMKIEKVEFFYDPGELIGSLLKGPTIAAADSSQTPGNPSLSCPFLNKQF
ncbi:hypothetical protein ACLOJK_016705 [Asimina triloba]